jgi:nucleoside-diphosphate-sugar epimerase
MRIFLIGGTGLLGSAAAAEFLSRGHSVKSIALPGIPKGAPIPEKMELTFGSFLEMTDDELLAELIGCDCFVFAAGVDERAEFPPPVYAAYDKYNIAPMRRLLTLSKEAGITKAVILGSYFAHFAERLPFMLLCDSHPYIRSRMAQQETALWFAEQGMDIAVLQLPYIFGTQPGRKPVWTILVEQLDNMPKGITLYPKGGTAMLTVRQVAQVIVGAAEKNKGGHAYPIACDNLTWDEFLTIAHTALGEPNRKILHIPRIAFKLFGLTMRKKYAARNVEMGIDPVGLADIMCMNTFLDTRPAAELGATPDDIKAAIAESIVLSAEAVRGGAELMGMKGG